MNVSNNNKKSYMVANAISRIFDTPVMILEIFLIFFIKTIMLKGKIGFTISFVILSGNLIIPITCFLVLYKSKKISDLDISKREERVKFFFSLVLCWTITLLLFNFLEVPHLLYTFQVWLVIFGILNACITVFWKISGHAMLSAGLSLWLVFLVNKVFILLFFTFIPLIIWARKKTNKHSIAQLITGVILILFETSIIWYFMIFKF